MRPRRPNLLIDNTDLSLPQGCAAINEVLHDRLALYFCPQCPHPHRLLDHPLHHPHQHLPEVLLPPHATPLDIDPPSFILRPWSSVFIALFIDARGRNGR
ncbi:MAG TPA: hypothetical protein VGW38_23250, partial [Chloroflexota bacterium]|nr:hypothetical protein [Chloroflexota bacterium]